MSEKLTAMNIGRTTLSLLGILYSGQVIAYSLTELWHIQAKFVMPESALIDTDRNAVYVSNVNNYAKDGNGFISRVALDGSILKLQWVEGMHSPTGMGLRGGKLYVADFDALVEIDLDSATILNRYDAPDFNPSLNDVAVSSDGQIYVSGSASNSIYVLSDSGLQVWLHDDDLLSQANGLFVAGNSLVHGGKHWSVFDRNSKELVGYSPIPDRIFSDIDGISLNGCQGSLFTLIDDARFWRITDSGIVRPISDIEFYGIDLFHLPPYLAVPRVGGSLSMMNIELNNCEGD